MKDKNIVNGVDVSGCMFCKDDWRCTAENVCSDSCKLVPDCTYKLKTLLKDMRKEIYKLKKTFTEIKEIAEYDVYTTRADLRFKLDLIKNKINEYEVKNG